MATKLPTICILAGGRGTRLGALTLNTPKPLLPVAGRPFIEHVLVRLRESGAHRVVLSIGYLAEQFRDALGDGRRFGLDLFFVEDGDSPAGTAGGVRNCLPLLGDRFIVVYGDSLLDVVPQHVVQVHEEGGRFATMTVLPAYLAHEAPNCVIQDGAVCEYSKTPRPQDATHIDYGMLIFESNAFRSFDCSSLSDIQSRLASAGELTACPVLNPYIEIGTPQSKERAGDILSAE